MKKTTLLIMAAGIGSRYGGGIKQLESVGPNGEIIIDYSIHDAIEAGFNKIVFIIRKDIEADFKEVIGDRIEKACAACGVEVAYAFQALDQIPSLLPEGRTKPWGTGQAVLAAKQLIAEPFAVINADDYYGKEAFQQVHSWLMADHADNAISMAGFILKNTLSENGGVTRGICEVDAKNMLTSVTETGNILSTAVADGKQLDPDAYVSMNFWGFANGETYMQLLEEGFSTFFETTVPSNPLKAEYLLPIHIGDLLEEGNVTVEVLPTQDKWFGVTYQEDKPAVVASIRSLIESGVYGERLFENV